MKADYTPSNPSLLERGKIENAFFFFTFSGESIDLSSSLLPTSYPTGDPSAFALPVFLEEPADAFATRARAALLKCRAAHALEADFECNGDIVSEGDGFNSSELVDPETSSRYVEATLRVTKDHVQDVLGEFECRCRAKSSRGDALSRTAVVRRACKSQDRSPENVKGNVKMCLAKTFARYETLDEIER